MMMVDAILTEKGTSASGGTPNGRESTGTGGESNGNEEDQPQKNFGPYLPQENEDDFIPMSNGWRNCAVNERNS